MMTGSTSGTGTAAEILIANPPRASFILISVDDKVMNKTRLLSCSSGRALPGSLIVKSFTLNLIVQSG